MVCLFKNQTDLTFPYQSANYKDCSKKIAHSDVEITRIRHLINKRTLKRCSITPRFLKSTTSKVTLNQQIMKTKTFEIRTMMKRSIFISFFLMVLLGQALSQLPGREGVETGKDQTLSPYFFIQSDDETDQMPLKSTDAQVQIAGVIADVSIRQVYENTGQNTLEAIYVFPASTRAAVYGMKMKIGEREIVAIVQERTQARQNYEQARANGQTASLLEQERPNVFTMNVANILPGDVIEVSLQYTELLIPESGIYEFVYPTVVGPRYQSGTSGESMENWVANPYLTEGKRPNYAFNIEVHVSMGLPIQSLQCRSHETYIDFTGKHQARITLKETEKNRGNKDFILDYRLSGGGIETGLLLFEGEEEKFFLAMIQPPRSVSQKTIPPREYIFVVDVSGSMHGFPLNISKQLMRALLADLRPVDRFNVLLFAGGSSVFAEQSVPANTGQIQKAIAFIDQQTGGGGTELLPALKRALALPGTEDYSRTFVIATDGYVSVERQTFEYMQEHLGRANFFTFGIGSSVNRYLIEGMAHVGKGEPFVITSESEAKPVAERFRKYISSPVLTGIETAFEGFDTYDVEPAAIPDVFAERPVMVMGKWRGEAAGTIAVTGRSGEGRFRNVLRLSEHQPDAGNKAIKYLWARERIRLMDDFAQVAPSDHELKTTITSLGLEYNLLTRFTSFIALDSEVRNASGQSTTVRQPLPLPEGVSHYAVGGVMPSVSRSSYRSGQKLMLGRPAVMEEMDYDATMPAPEPEVYYISEVMPVFKGHEKGLEAFIANHLKQVGVTGFVYVEFVVDTDGSVRDIRILRGLNEAAGREAMRVIRMTDKQWEPGTQNEKPVPVKLTVAVAFK
jgi:Ca-activated chloride channel family protein